MKIDRAIEILNPEHRENYDGMDEVNEACRMGMEALERTRWIPCSERLPEGVSRCLVCRFDYVTKTRFIDILWFEAGAWWNRLYGGDFAVTHWMPLPEPPKEEQNETD